jgi:ABC-2 type transport system permease protein
MFKLWSTIVKDVRILTRDKVGLAMMFLMPIILAVVIATIQNSTFELVNDNKVPLILCNKDTGEVAKGLVHSIEKAGFFEITNADTSFDELDVAQKMKTKDALVAIVISASFSKNIQSKAGYIAAKALVSFGMEADTSTGVDTSAENITVYYHPVLQQSFRQSINGAIRGALQLAESKQVLQTLSSSFTEKNNTASSLEEAMQRYQSPVKEITVSRGGGRNIPNATQHNIPAWTIFAMFFVVISLGSSVVREKLSGSFIRLKTMPTNYLTSFLSKQLTYLLVTVSQAAVIFAIGVWLFPLMGLPQLNIPADITGLTIVTLVCGWCAVSFAMLVGTLAQTQEQANGFGAVSIVILAAIGGLMVPSFAMPASFKTIMLLSPLHWCLEAYYGLFLEGGNIKDIFANIIPLLIITFLFQAISVVALKRQKLI